MVDHLARAPAAHDVAIEVVVVDDGRVVQELRSGHAVGRDGITQTHDFSFILLESTTRVSPSCTIEVIN